MTLFAQARAAPHAEPTATRATAGLRAPLLETTAAQLDTAPAVVAQRRIAAGLNARSRAVLPEVAVAATAPVVQRFSFLAGPRWLAYRATLHDEVPCPAIDSWEAKTTMHLTRDVHGNVTKRRITLHAYQNNAWHDVGSITMDRNAVPGQAMADQQGPPPPTYDDSILTLHTASAGGTGNAGVATHLFPAALRWIDSNLHGVQEVNMNPLGGAAAKSVVERLSAQLGDPDLHAEASVARALRKRGGGPGIGSGSDTPINTWDARLNEEHIRDLHALEHAPAGLWMMADGATLAGPGDPQELANLQQLRDHFINRPPTDLSQDPTHPASAYFATARALTDQDIAANPKAAARLLRIARLSTRSGPTGTGGTIDPGYQIRLSGPALADVLPQATQ